MKWSSTRCSSRCRRARRDRQRVASGDRGVIVRAQRSRPDPVHRSPAVRGHPRTSSRADARPHRRRHRRPDGEVISLRQLSFGGPHALRGRRPDQPGSPGQRPRTRFEAESVEKVAGLLEAAPPIPNSDNAEQRMAAQTHVHAARRHQRSVTRRGRPRNGVAMSALAGGVFAVTDSHNDDTQLRQLVDDLGQRSYDAGLGHRGIPDQFDAELWGNLEDTGLARLTSTPDMGAGPHELAIALYGVARHAGAVPLAETDALAGWLGQQTGSSTRRPADRRNRRCRRRRRPGHRHRDRSAVGSSVRRRPAGRHHARRTAGRRDRRDPR